MRSTLRLVILALLLCAITAFFVWDLFRTKPFKEVYEEKQILCLAAILRADAYGEEPNDRGKAQELIADSAMRLREYRQKKVTFCEILEGGLTIYPHGWTRAKTFIGRYTFAIRYSWFYPGSPWIEAENRARTAIGRGPAADTCATYYTRAAPGYEGSTNERDAAEWIRSNLRLAPHQESGLKMKFYCP